MPYSKPYSEEVREKMREYTRKSYYKKLAEDPNEREKLNNKARVRRKTVPRTDRERELARNRAKARRAEDIVFKVCCNLRTRLYCAVRNQQKGGSAVKDLGCSVEFFLDYIANQFEEGMSWDNWALDTWHLDHILPLTAFDLTSSEGVKKACHFTNIRPMWAVENISKGKKIPDSLLSKHYHERAYPDNF